MLALPAGPSGLVWDPTGVDKETPQRWKGGERSPEGKGDDGTETRVGLGCDSMCVHVSEHVWISESKHTVRF